MAKSIPELLNNKESRERILAKAKAEVGGGGILDMIPAYGPDGKPLEEWINLGRMPKPHEIADETTDVMILENKAILKAGRKVTW